MNTVPQTVLTLAFVYQTLARVTRRRIADVARAPDSYNNQHRSSQLGDVTDFTDGIGFSVDHIASAEHVLTNGDQTAGMENKGHMAARLLMFQGVATFIGKYMRV